MYTYFYTKLRSFIDSKNLLNGIPFLHLFFILLPHRKNILNPDLNGHLF